MSILKALLISILLSIIHIAIYLGIDQLIKESIPNNYVIHYIGLIPIITTIIGYLTIFKIFRISFDWENMNNKIGTINLKIVFYLLILTIGLELFDRPFFDFSKIVDFLNGIVNEPYVQSKKPNISLIYTGLYYIILAPIFEELLFRKYMYTKLSKKYSENLSIITSSILFSLIHLPSYRNLIPTLIFGIICCIIYKKTKNISYTIILHILANLSWFIFENYGEIYYKWIFGLKYNLIYWTVFGIGITLILFGMKKITTANNVYSS
ncbi:CPBP family intramembrane glutamic endopeptidase [Aequorivita xiaoshiensis]|uniref:CPBP family intramembrane metalloprotease n=1 Tax=Aequorivita xiaoshiensis TaxID=2874476 RepID=A0A9X1UE00_9FLAO|nr:type II CAAX endopeptidase family protein [Aequorivita xiaoshiensis]MCG2432121.1 CPBP family intramembrane metalloprotease [Aequorivita xiaoshiensis]